jgi:hypothetical protein
MEFLGDLRHNLEKINKRGDLAEGWVLREKLKDPNLENAISKYAELQQAKDLRSSTENRHLHDYAEVDFHNRRTERRLQHLLNIGNSLVDEDEVPDHAIDTWQTRVDDVEQTQQFQGNLTRELTAELLVIQREINLRSRRLRTSGIDPYSA